jgi:hypothetical protein
MLTMKNQFLFTILILCSFFRVSAQADYTLKENNNWKFYQYGGLRFVNNVPVADTSSMKWSYDASGGAVQTINAASVSDEQGSLLFYSDAYNVWNRNHQLMPNGDSLMTSNAMDAALIVPVLSNHNQYYLFYMVGTIDFFSATTNAYQLMYSIIDMSLDNGLGDVVPGQKNILVASNLSGSMKAIPGNDCNIWLVTHDTYNTQFKAFEITAAGLNTTAVNSNVGNGAVGFMGPLSFGGNLAVSHDRSHLAFAQNSGEFIPILELFDFNPSTAAVTNARVIDTLQFIFGYSLCFSPNNSKLYLSMLNPGEIYPNNPNNLHIESSLFQYNLNAGSNTAIQNSRLLLTDSISSYNNVMRMGPDGKIYLPSSYGGDTSTATSGYFYGSTQSPGNYSGPPFQAYIGCIQNPDVTGTGCNLNRKAIALPAYSSGAETMGGIYVKPIPGDTVLTVHDTVFCNMPASQMMIQSPFAGFYQEWDDGSVNAQRTITASGTYWVRNGDYCHYRVDTFVVDIESISPIISVAGSTLSTTIPFLHYQWLYENNIIPGATNSTYAITQNGHYAVIAGNDHCLDTSNIYTATNVTGINDPANRANRIKVYPNPATSFLNIDAPFPVDVTISSIEGKVISSNKHEHTISIATLSKGVYFLRISDENGTLLKVEKIVKQ